MEHVKRRKRWGLCRDCAKHGDHEQTIDRLRRDAVGREAWDAKKIQESAERRPVRTTRLREAIAPWNFFSSRSVGSRRSPGLRRSLHPENAVLTGVRLPVSDILLTV